MFLSVQFWFIELFMSLSFKYIPPLMQNGKWIILSNINEKKLQLLDFLSQNYSEECTVSFLGTVYFFFPWFISPCSTDSFPQTKIHCAWLKQWECLSGLGSAVCCPHTQRDWNSLIRITTIVLHRLRRNCCGNTKGRKEGVSKWHYDCDAYTVETVAPVVRKYIINA